MQTRRSMPVEGSGEDRRGQGQGRTRQDRRENKAGQHTQNTAGRHRRLNRSASTTPIETVKPNRTKPIEKSSSYNPKNPQKRDRFGREFSWFTGHALFLTQQVDDDVMPFSSLLFLQVKQPGRVDIFSSSFSLSVFLDQQFLSVLFSIFRSIFHHHPVPSFSWPSQHAYV